MKYYIIAGEPSGDLHASNLMKEIHRIDSAADIRFWGGDLMEAAGGTIAKHYKDLAFMGFVEVVKNIPTIFKNISFCKKDIADFSPDTIIFIDYSGFNLRIAKWAKKEDFFTNYYISPQVWASRSGRVKTIKKCIDKMYVILPFVKDFYKKYDLEVEYVGHPLLDAINDRAHDENNLDYEKKIIALLPGSRKQEITHMLPVMLSLVNDFKEEYQFVIAGAPSQEFSFYNQFIQDAQLDDIPVLFGKTYDILEKSHVALVTSGTATLEASLFKVPQVVCYKGGSVSYSIAKRIINVEYISLVNLIRSKEIVRELIQSEFNKENLSRELVKLLKGDGRGKMLEEYDILHQQLGKGASANTAKGIYSDLIKKVRS